MPGAEPGKSGHVGRERPRELAKCRSPDAPYEQSQRVGARWVQKDVHTMQGSIQAPLRLELSCTRTTSLDTLALDDNPSQDSPTGLDFEDIVPSTSKLV